MIVWSTTSSAVTDKHFYQQQPRRVADRTTESYCILIFLISILASCQAQITISSVNSQRTDAYLTNICLDYHQQWSVQKAKLKIFAFNDPDFRPSHQKHSITQDHQKQASHQVLSYLAQLFFSKVQKNTCIPNVQIYKVKVIFTLTVWVIITLTTTPLSVTRHGPISMLRLCLYCNHFITRYRDYHPISLQNSDFMLVTDHCKYSIQIETYKKLLYISSTLERWKRGRHIHFLNRKRPTQTTRVNIKVKTK